MTYLTSLDVTVGVATYYRKVVDNVLQFNFQVNALLMNKCLP
jgi:hypothetical protein